MKGDRLTASLQPWPPAVSLPAVRPMSPLPCRRCFGAPGKGTSPVEVGATGSSQVAASSRSQGLGEASSSPPSRGS